MVCRSYGPAVRSGAAAPAYVRARCFAACVGATLLLAACSGGGGGDGGAPAVVDAPTVLDDGLTNQAVTSLELTGDPASARGAAQTRPDADPLVKLGQLLFFSQTLAAGYDVSCGTCHHPDFGGSDGLSLSVGVVPRIAATVGPGREVDPARDLDPLADGGPNMHRNSLTTLNAGLFDRGLMYDGRVETLDATTAPGGRGQRVRTPESGLRHDLDTVDGLLEFTVKGPIVNDNEMRGFAYVDHATPTAYREHLARRLRGDVEAERNTEPDAAARWLARFHAAFAAPEATAGELITVLNVQRALAAYIDSQVFVDTPWRSYLGGSLSGISEDAKRGAVLFLTPLDEGGLGCAGCHSGDRFTDEAFHNVGFPQLGRGFGRTDGTDLGRWLTTRADSDRHAFRTPGLLNVASTAPYGHAGSFATLEDVIRYHADPRGAVESYDFTLRHLEQLRAGDVAYPEADALTRAAIAAASFPAAEARLPRRALTAAETTALAAFLRTLTDRCVADPVCIGQWAPRADEDPDGHTLVRDRSGMPPVLTNDGTPGSYPESIPLAFPATPERTTFADVQGCTDGLATADNSGLPGFTQRSAAATGLVDAHGYSQDTWFGRHQTTVEVAMVGGGISGAYVDDDCWPDLVFAGGASGMHFYRNVAGGYFEPFEALSTPPDGREFTGAAIADLNGDYRRELVFGNVSPGAVPVYARNGAGTYDEIASLPMTRPTYGISFAPLDASGLPYMYLAHWAAGSGTDGTAPALWRSDGTALFAWDRHAATTAATIDQRFNFTPKFADFTGDGRADLVIASDFSTSMALRNLGDAALVNETQRGMLSDENGMGSALLDVDNDGGLEWFVTSISDDALVRGGNWGVSGNRMYRSYSTPDRIAFADVTDATGVRHGYWGWGACAADFDNDGFIDLVQTNGFGRIPDDVLGISYGATVQNSYDTLTRDAFQDKPTRLFINNGDGTFSAREREWGMDVPSEGRGVVCFDPDRDGDVDVVVFDHSRRPQFFENRIGSGPGRRFLNVRLVGAPPNTDAIGARVQLTADVGNGHGMQSQLRLGEANSNFNSQNPPDLHFGLGEAARVDSIRVSWAGGAELVCDNVPVNSFIVLDERAGPAACPAPD